jgi:ubiquinone/menaquinone biosynthesis C-methylase UbiE
MTNYFGELRRADNNPGRKGKSMGDGQAAANSFIWREDRYRDILRTPQKNDLLVKIWREAYGDEYPEEADPFGFVTCSDLNTVCAELKIKPGDTLLDIGCGRGGPGLWVARRTGASLIGIDIVPEAIAHANESKGEVEARFAVGSFINTHLPSISVHAIMSIDAFWMVLDKAAALKEMARVIQPGKRFVMTTWMPPYIALEPMMTAEGFRLVSSRETERWKDRQMAVYKGVLRHRKELEACVDAGSLKVLLAEAQAAKEQLPTSPRFLIVAEKQG